MASHVRGIAIAFGGTMQVSFSLLRVFLLVLTSVAVTGCAIVPGHTLSPSKGDQETTGALPYRVVEVTPSMLVRLREAEQQRLQAERDPALKSMQELRREGYEYRIGPGDIVSVVVWEHPELTNPGNELRSEEAAGRLVDADGTMFYPYVGDFRVEGMRISDARDYISRNLQRVIRDPQVDVRVLSHRSKRVYVTGEVLTPGLVILNDVPRGILDVINERGGLKETASQRTAIISRDGESHRVNLQALYAYGMPEYNIALEPGDVVHVPDNSGERVFVLGEVGQEGAQPIQRKTMTLTEALSNAQGIEPLSGKDAGVFVFRSGAYDDMGEFVPGSGDSGTSQPAATVFTLDVGKLEGFLIADRFRLQPRDVVYVAATGFAKYNRVIQQILPTVSTLFQLERLVDTD